MIGTVKIYLTVLGLTGILLSPWPAAASSPAPAAEPSLVRLHVTYQETDYSSPWKQRREDSRSGYGCVVSPGRILTTADIVKDATMIKVEKRRDKRYYQGRIEVIDYDVDLALLSVDDDSFFADLHPIELEERVEVGQPVQVLIFEEPDRIRSLPGTIVKVSVEHYYLGVERFLTFGAAVNFEDRGGGWSEAVISEGKLAGLMMTYDGQRQYAVIIPAAIISRFLAAAGSEGYSGFAHEGFSGTDTLAPALREFLRIPDGAGGVYVTDVYPRGSAAGVLRPGDVLLEIDGRPLDAEGYYEDPLWGPLEYRDLITRFYRPGDRVELKLIREEEELQVEMELRRWLLSDYLVPPYSCGFSTRYLIFGGAIIQELTLDYLKEWGGQWRQRANKKLFYQYYHNLRRPLPGRKRIVLLNRVLPHEINLGYQGLEDLVLAEVNGRPISQIGDVAEALGFPEGGFHRFVFEEFGREIVFPAEGLEEADRQISLQYGIPRMRLLE